MIARKLIAAALFSVLATGAAFAQATTNAPPKPGAATPPPAVVAPATTPAKPAAATAPSGKPAAATPAATAKPAPAVAPKPAAATAIPPGAKVNLNTATAEELDKLPQIGPARANAIVDARAKGKFKNWDDFVARKVVPSNAVTAIQNQVSF